MRETEAEPPVPADLLAPLPPEHLPPAVQKVLAGPAAARTMAARGMAPLRPVELAVTLYQLAFDADPGLSATAQSAPGALPEPVLLALVKESLPPAVLHFFGTRLSEQRAGALDALLLNAATPDATFAVLAGRLSERFVDIIFANETRLLRAPAIVKALFGNRHARMSSVNRALELCARNGVEVDVPGFQEIVQEIRQAPEALDTAIDAAFAAVANASVVFEEHVLPSEPALEGFDESADTAADAETLGDDETPEAEAPEAPAKPEDKRKSAIIDFNKLKIYEKIRLATLGNAYCRNHLIRDSNRLVAMAVIKSPMITDSEVIAASSNKAVHEDVIRYIANSRDFTKIYAIRWGLVNNPKCPLTVAMRFLTTLTKTDLKKVAKSKNIPAALSTTARRFLSKAPS